MLNTYKKISYQSDEPENVADLTVGGLLGVLSSRPYSTYDSKAHYLGPSLYIIQRLKLQCRPPRRPPTRHVCVVPFHRGASCAFALLH